jgi:cyclopropane fatty-acyl-phospholipid synthase-like methyltransferase
MSRILGERTPLDYDQIESFFERRSARIAELGLLRATMYQDEDLASRRDAHEKESILPLLGLSASARVLDIGCGVGRWADAVAPQVAAYLGTDLCESYVAAGTAKFAAAGLPPTTHRFQRLRAQDLSASGLALPGPFDVVIIAGLMVFLNDEDVAALLATIRELAPQGTLYIREPVGLETRLTLKNHFSEELGDYYGAIYRTVAEYHSLFAQSLAPCEIPLSRGLFPPELCNRKETAQHVFLIQLPPPRAHAS